MKTVKLFIIAAVTVAAIIGLWQLLGNSDDVVIDKGESKETTFQNISRSIEEMGKSKWNKDLYSKKYKSITARIQNNRTNRNLGGSDEANTLSDKVEMTYINILIEGITTHISDCDHKTMEQLKQELNGFATEKNYGMDGFTQAVENMKAYSETNEFVNNVSNLRYTEVNNLNKKFPDAKYYLNKAETLKGNSFVIRCERIRKTLDNINEELCEAHCIFLEKKTNLFLSDSAGFVGLDSIEINKKFESIYDEFSDFRKTSFYPYSVIKKADPSLRKLEAKKEELINLWREAALKTKFNTKEDAPISQSDTTFNN
jgi:coenzyme F420-reducing hydrogenase alpha subunit